MKTLTITAADCILDEAGRYHHAPTPYAIEVDIDPMTITSQTEVVACCGNSQIPANQRNAAFIVRSCNAHAILVELAEKVIVHFNGTDAPLLNFARMALKLANGE